MRLRFQDRPLDVYFLLTYGLVLSALLQTPGGANPLALLLVLFVPGYLATAALFPADGEIDWIRRTGLSVGLSLAIVALIGLVLNATPWGLGVRAAAASLGTAVAALGVLAYWTRTRLPPRRRLSVTLDLRVPSMRGLSPLEKVISVILLVGMLVAGGLLVNVLIGPRPGARYTELALLDETGRLEAYPLRLNASESGSVIIRVVNHEFTTVDYTVRVDLVGIAPRYNATTGRYETIELNRTTWSWFNFTIAHDQDWSEPYGFSIGTSGLWKVQFLLFRDRDFDAPYRNVFVTVTVR